MMVTSRKTSENRAQKTSARRAKTACGKISPNTTIKRVLETPAISPLNLPPITNEVADTVATFVSKMPASVRWVFLRKGRTRRAALLPSLALRLRSAKSSAISATFRPEHNAENPTNSATTSTKTRPGIIWRGLRGSYGQEGDLRGLLAYKALL